jgi:hypothetical protein
MYDTFSVPVYSGSSLPEGYQSAWRLRLSPSSPLPTWTRIRLFRLSYQCSLSVYFELTPPRAGFLRLSGSVSLPFHRPSVYSPELCQYLEFLDEELALFSDFRSSGIRFISGPLIRTPGRLRVCWLGTCPATLPRGHSPQLEG